MLLISPVAHRYATDLEKENVGKFGGHLAVNRGRGLALWTSSRESDEVGET